MWLYDLCRKSRPRTLVEIGTSYGFSTLFLLAAIAKNSLGQLTSIDPYARSFAHGIALASVSALGVESSFRYLEERSDRAAVDLAREGASFEFVFIDGSHRFDDVLTDFYLFAPLCASGCDVIFDDLWMASIQSVVSFVRTNRTDFQERPTPEPNIAVFRKVGADSRSWDHFRPFSVSRGSGGSQ
jgi:predicted O-methyltransferase YrrM